MDEWLSCALGELISLEYGSALGAEERTGEGYPVFGSNGVVGYHARPLVSGPGIVVGRKGSAGALVWSDSDFWPIDTTYWVKPKAELELRWVYDALRRCGLERLHSSTGVPGLNRDDAYERRVPVPPLEEQRRIAEILETIDESIQVTARVIAKLSDLMKGLIADQLLMADDGCRVSLAEVAEISGGLALSAERAVPDAVELPYLRVANVQDGYIDTTTMRTVRVSRGDVDRYAVHRGDVLMNEGGDFDKLGRGAVWDGRIDPCLHQNHVFRVRCVPDLLVPEFLALFCQSHEVKSYFVNNSKQTTNLASINKTQIGALPTLVPDLARQRRTISAVETLQSRIDAEAEEASGLRALRSGLASDLLSGRMRTVAA